MNTSRFGFGLVLLSVLPACGGGSGVTRPNAPVGAIANDGEALDFLRGAGMFALTMAGPGNLNGQEARAAGSQTPQNTTTNVTCVSTEGLATDADTDGMPADQKTNYGCEFNTGDTSVKYSGNLRVRDAGDSAAFNGATVELNDIRFENDLGASVGDPTQRTGSFLARGLSSSTYAANASFTLSSDVEVQAEGNLRSLFYSSNAIGATTDFLVSGFYGDSVLAVTATPTSLSTMVGTLSSLSSYVRFRRGLNDRVVFFTAAGVTFDSSAGACGNTTTLTTNPGYWKDGVFAFQDASGNKITAQYTSCVATYTYTTASGYATPIVYTP
jgi:hypothetical protein